MINQRKLLISIGLSVVIGNVCYSFAVNSMNNALKTMLKVFDVAPSDEGLVKGILTSSTTFGCLIGAILNLSFKKANIRSVIILGDLFMIIGSLIMTINNLYSFIIGRTLTGIGGGIVSAFCTVYLKQIAPANLYGIVGGIYPIIFSSSVILTQSFGFLFLIDGWPNFWRIYFSVPCIFSVLRIVLFLVFIKFTTPLNYIQLNQEDQARYVIQKIYDRELEQEIFDQAKRQAEKKAAVNLTSKKFRIRIMLAFSLQILFQFCGLNAMLQYSTSIFEEMVSKEVARYLTLSIAILKATCYASATVLSQKYGRRSMFLSGNGMMLIFNILISCSSFFLEHNETTTLQITLIIMIFAFLICNFLSISPLVPIYMPEIVPQQIVSLSWILHWGGNVIVVLTFPILVEHFQMGYIFIGYMLIIIIGQVIIYQWAVDTTDRTDSEVDSMFKTQSTVHDTLIK